MAAAMHDKHWWSQPLSAAFEDLASNPGGLSDAEAAARLERFGPNPFRDRPVQSLFLPFLPMTPAQILLNNMLYDISADASSASCRRRPSPTTCWLRS